jgi:hypothetical protein
MRHASIYVFLLLLTLSGVGCKSRRAGSALEQQLGSDMKAVCQTWKKDAWGCEKVRDAEMAQQIAEALHPHQPSLKDVSGLIGAPEFTKTNAGKTYAAYYFDGDCLGGKLKEGSVYCVLEFYFDAETQAWVSVSVVCG